MQTIVKAEIEKIAQPGWDKITQLGYKGVGIQVTWTY
jgi:hypothetical protein